MECIKKEVECKYRHMGGCLPGYCQLSNDMIIERLDKMLSKMEHIGAAQENNNSEGREFAVDKSEMPPDLCDLVEPKGPAKSISDKIDAEVLAGVRDGRLSIPTQADVHKMPKKRGRKRGR